jgi:hypothetical protein
LDVLVLFPGSLFGKGWAGGPRVKPELVATAPTVEAQQHPRWGDARNH